MYNLQGETKLVGVAYIAFLLIRTVNLVCKYMVYADIRNAPNGRLYNNVWPLPIANKYTDLFGDETKYQYNIILMSVPCSYCCLPFGPSSFSSFV